MSHEFENATNSIGDIQQRLELFMSTCQRCGRCFKEPVPLEQLKLKGYRFDDLAERALDLPLQGLPRQANRSWTTSRSNWIESPAAAMLKNLCQKMFGRSLWVYHANSGGCNGCDIEVLNVLTPYYDAERFGIKLVGSPRHADVMLCQGPAMRSTAKALQRAYEAMPAPKLVFAIGSCACGGGIWFDTYTVLGPVEKIVPVNFYIPGCPPRPEAIIYGVAVAVGLVDKKTAPGPVQATGAAHPALPPQRPARPRRNGRLREGGTRVATDVGRRSPPSWSTELITELTDLLFARLPVLSAPRVRRRV